MTGLVFIWRVNLLERTVQAHAGPIFSMFSSNNCIVTGAKERLVYMKIESRELRALFVTDVLRIQHVC